MPASLPDGPCRAMKVDKVPRMRRVTTTTLICALIFGLLSTWLGPKMIAYWYTPPVPAGAFNCTDAVQWAMNKLVVTQVIGTFIGVVVGIRSEEHTSELQSLRHLVCRLLLEKKNNT